MCRGGVPPWGLLKPPPKLQKSCCGQNARVAANISRVAADILCVASDILRVVVDKAVEEAKSCWPKNFFHFFENFSKFFGIFKGENTLFSKSAQKMV